MGKQWQTLSFGAPKLLQMVTELSWNFSPYYLFNYLLPFSPLLYWVQFSSVAQSCPTLCDPMDCSIPGLLVHHELPVYSNSSPLSPVMPPSHLNLSRSLLLQPSIFPSIRVFSNESVLPIRWPKYWSFSFSISPINEHPGLVSFRMDWLDLLAVQATLESLLQHHSSEASIEYLLVMHFLN